MDFIAGAKEILNSDLVIVKHLTNGPVRVFSRITGLYVQIFITILAVIYRVFSIEKKWYFYMLLFSQSENIKRVIFPVWKWYAAVTSRHVLHAGSKIWKT